MIRLLSRVTYLLAIILGLGAMALAYHYGTSTFSLPQNEQIDLTRSPESSSAKRLPSAAEIDRYWSQPLRRPLEDPPAPAPSTPAPPPAPPLQVTLVGMVKEKDRSFALLDIANAGRHLVKAGDAITIQGLEVKIDAIAETGVTLTIGKEQLVVERKD